MGIKIEIMSPKLKEMILQVDPTAFGPVEQKPAVGLERIKALFNRGTRRMERSPNDDEAFIALYNEHHSVHKVGALLGVSGQTVLNRLTFLGVKAVYKYSPGVREWTKEDVDIVRQYYSDHPHRGSFCLDDLARLVGKTRHAVAIKAGRLGLGKPARRSEGKTKTEITLEEKRSRRLAFESLTDQEKHKVYSDRQKKNIATNGHPRGMLGKHHTQETKDALSKSSSGRKRPRDEIARTIQTKIERYGSVNPKGHPKTSWKAHWVTVGQKRFYARSMWEANYARYLEWLREHGEIKEWDHEPKTFWFTGLKRGCVSYLPDFRVVTWTDEEEFHEVKGWMDAASKTKIKRMAKYYPEVKLVVIDSVRYSALSKTCKRLVPNWNAAPQTGNKV